MPFKIYIPGRSLFIVHVINASQPEILYDVQHRLILEKRDELTFYVNALKPAKTYEEQVEIIRSKGSIVDNDEVCIAFLQTTDYYRLSAYLLPFRKPDGSYFENINFSRIRRIYEFDSHLRSVLFQCIEKIEIYLRTQNYSGHHFDALGYLNADNFSPRHNKEKSEALVLKCIEENKQSLVVKHHIEKYSGKFPVWVIIEFFSMGMLSCFNGDMKTPGQKALAKNISLKHIGFPKNWSELLKSEDMRKPQG